MKQSVLILVFMFASSMIQAEVLSWRVDIDGGAGNTSYVFAQLFTTQTTGVGYQLTGTSLGAQMSQNNEADGVWQRNQDLVGLGTADYFYVRLFAADGTTPAGYSGLLSWTQLELDSALVSGTVPDFPATTPWNAGTSVVPEPTSMGLLAIGMSALLLRRRRRM
jgi:hypothetical protein